MASCSRCEAETELYDSGVPICLACANREAKRPPENGVAGHEDQPSAAKKPAAEIPPEPGRLKTGA
jgi:hypothetical protein